MNAHQIRCAAAGCLSISLSVTTASAADRMLGAQASDGALFVKRFEVSAGARITGVRFEGNLAEWSRAVDAPRDVVALSG